MITITCKTNTIFPVADRDVTITVDGLTYQAAILPPDDETPDAYSVYLFAGRHEASASIPVDGCESLSMLLATMIQGRAYNADVAALDAVSAYIFALQRRVEVVREAARAR